jgi:hypothetical protein
MTMHRRPLGRGRTLAAVSAIVLLIGCILPWWTVGGGSDLPTHTTTNGFDSSGILVFIVALATLALLTLPYAAGDRPIGVDRWPVYLVFVVVGWVGLGYVVVDLLVRGVLAASLHAPSEVFTRGPGLWVAGIGLAMLSRAVYDMRQDPAVR